jgi:hypothetical protein
MNPIPCPEGPLAGPRAGDRKGARAAKGRAMLPDLPDLGLLAISLLGFVGLCMLCLALMVAGGLMLARAVAERHAPRALAGRHTSSDPGDHAHIR